MKARYNSIHQQYTIQQTGGTLPDSRALSCAYAHGKAQITHGEGFGVCYSRQRTHGKLFHGELYFYSRPNYGHTANFAASQS